VIPNRPRSLGICGIDRIVRGSERFCPRLVAWCIAGETSRRCSHDKCSGCEACQLHPQRVGIRREQQLFLRPMKRLDARTSQCRELSLHRRRKIRQTAWLASRAPNSGIKRYLPEAGLPRRAQQSPQRAEFERRARSKISSPMPSRLVRTAAERTPRSGTGSGSEIR